jgi:hypothetical protein
MKLKSGCVYCAYVIIVTIIIINHLIPTIKIGKSFECLRRYFDFDISNQEHKSKGPKGKSFSLINYWN